MKLKLEDMHLFSAYLYAGQFVLVFIKFSIYKTRSYGGLWPPISSSCGGLVAFGHLEGPLGPLQLQMLGGPFANKFYLGRCRTGSCSSLSFKATEELHPSMDSGEP